MCYLVAKDANQHGCFAFPTTAGPELVELKRYLAKHSKIEWLQLFTISRPAAYGEYAPYTIIKDKNAFIEAGLSM